jgi:hypothetical protein
VDFFYDSRESDLGSGFLVLASESFDNFCIQEKILLSEV